MPSGVAPCRREQRHGPNLDCNGACSESESGSATRTWASRKRQPWSISSAHIRGVQSRLASWCSLVIKSYFSYSRQQPACYKALLAEIVSNAICSLRSMSSCILEGGSALPTPASYKLVRIQVNFACLRFLIQFWSRWWVILFLNDKCDWCL